MIEKKRGKLFLNNAEIVFNKQKRTLTVNFNGKNISLKRLRNEIDFILRFEKLTKQERLRKITRLEVEREKILSLLIRKMKLGMDEKNRLLIYDLENKIGELTKEISILKIIDTTEPDWDFKTF